MTQKNGIQALIDKWKAEANLLRTRYGDERRAQLIEALASELDNVARSHSARLVTLTEATALSGYSRDHLRRLIREGRIPNHGRRGSPRIAVLDLPIKPRSQALSAGGERLDFCRLLRHTVNSE